MNLSLVLRILKKVCKVHLSDVLETLLHKVCYTTITGKLGPWLEMGPLSVRLIRKSFLSPISN